MKKIYILGIVINILTIISIVVTGMVAFSFPYINEKNTKTHGIRIIEPKFLDNIAPDYNLVKVSSKYYIDTAIFSIFSREKLDFTGFDGEVIKFTTNSENGYYYELVSQLDTYGINEIKLFIADHSGNTISEIIKVDHIQQFDQSIDIPYVEDSLKPRILTSISLDTKVDHKNRLYAAYSPDDLEIVGTRGIPTSDVVYLRKEALNHLSDMYNNLKHQGIDLLVTSGYRSFQSQIYTYDYIKAMEGPLSAQNKVAIPGHSEHQLGLAVDLVNDETHYRLPSPGSVTRLYTWLKEHAREYGFVQTYDGADDTIHEELWHYRYIGSD